MILHASRFANRHGGILVAMFFAFGVFIALPGLGFLSMLGSQNAFAGLSPTQWHAVRETLVMLAGVAAFVLIVGVGAAWLVAVHEFPGRRLFEILLILPLAFPTYLAAFVAVDLMHFFGPVQGLYRWLTGAKSARDYWFPEMRSMGGAIIVLGLVLFPYVYVPCRIVFSRSGRNIIDAARLLGASGWDLFLRVGLPIARPAMIAGLVLALLEALNDIGAAEYLGVSSLSVLIRDVWANRGDLASATRLAAVLLALVALLLLFDPTNRSARQASARAGRAQPSRVPLHGLAGAGASLFCLLPVLLGFLVPVTFLVSMLVRYSLAGTLDPAFFEAAFASVMIAASVSLIVMALGALIAVGIRLIPKLGRARLLTTLGYATPGTVLALAILPVIRVSDDILAAIGIGALLTASSVVMLYALSVRFLGIGVTQAGVALQRLPRNVDAVARVHGMHDLALALRVHLPVMAPGLMLGGILVFIDAIKELPATILLRPLNLETLATRAYSLASVGLFEKAALEALTIVALSGLAAFIFARRA